MVDVLIYNTVGNYINKKFNGKKTIPLSKKDFIRYLINAGGFRNKGVSFNGQRFYFHLVNMALTESNQKFYMTSDYSNSESSIKSAISYFIGILSAYAIAEKEYKIPYLYHLKDPAISRIVNTTKHFPDFFGLGYGSINNAYLIEAKGSVKSSIDKKTITKAKKQVNSIGQLTFKESSGNSHNITRFKRHITASYFQNDELKFCDVDPNFDGDLEYYLDANVAILRYYKNIMELLVYSNKKIEVKKINEVEYSLVDFEGYQIGINTRIFKLLKEYSGNINNLPEDCKLYNSITEISMYSYENTPTSLRENKSISLGRDGIIVI
ncbi:hypothetical protein [Streptococcus sp. HPH0090]|uniref:hypothetical protein n=1 Tax=Streptococcus sp. HPH0090 TaxID=1203590 RepID=UPI00034E8E1B|nr:hypothetical protein [Streptococcus sp. HPH0090]EPD87534.1 hypothetical protein HMPREF1481_00623 [Streptococcus sp. HPH0090]